MHLEKTPIKNHNNNDTTNYDTSAIIIDFKYYRWILQLTGVEELLAEGDIDCSINEELNDEQIITAIMQQADEAVEEGDERDEPAVKVSHAEAKQGFNVALLYKKYIPHKSPVILKILSSDTTSLPYQMFIRDRICPITIPPP